jgi:hypothetical protein
MGTPDDVRAPLAIEGATMTSPNPEDPAAADELDEAVRASEQHRLAEEHADEDEDEVRRDPETGDLHEERAQ